MENFFHSDLALNLNNFEKSHMKYDHVISPTNPRSYIFNVIVMKGSNPLPLESVKMVAMPDQENQVHSGNWSVPTVRLQHSD